MQYFPYSLSLLSRSPMCRLIASEDLFALMDALEEPVPDEVHQYLGNGGSFGAIEVGVVSLYCRIIFRESIYCNHHNTCTNSTC